MNYNSWELTDFNIDGHIILSQKYGLLKIMRTEDGTLVLTGDAEYGVIDQENVTPVKFVRTDSLLGFILDIGIQKKKSLTYRGFYFGTQLLSTQSNRKVSQNDFNQDVFDGVASLVQTKFESQNKDERTEAIKFQLLLNEYNNALLLYPNFHSESYLTLMRIIDASCDGKAGELSVFASTISPTKTKLIYEKITEMEVYKDRKTGVYSPEGLLEEETKLNDLLLDLQNQEQASDIAMHETMKDVHKLSELVKNVIPYYNFANPHEKEKIIRVIFSELCVSENTLTYKCKSGFECFENRLLTFCDPTESRTPLTGMKSRCPNR